MARSAKIFQRIFGAEDEEKTKHEKRKETGMFRLLLTTISYGALVLLVMPATGMGMLAAACLLVLGVALILRKNMFETAFRKCDWYYFGSIAGLVSFSFCLIFYNRWFASSKIRAIVEVLHVPHWIFLWGAALALSLTCVYAVCIGLQMVRNSILNPERNDCFKCSLLACVAASVLTVIFAQVMSDVRGMSMGIFRFLWGVLIVFTVILFLYGLLGRVMPSILIGTVGFMVISTVNVYVYQFRNRLFEPVDIYSFGTAMNVAESYSLFPIPSNLIGCWGLWIAFVLAVSCLHRKEGKSLAGKRRGALLAVCALCSVSIFFYCANLKTYHWNKEGVVFNGYILDFTAKIKEITVQKPDHYSTERIADLTKRYAEADHGDKGGASKQPHIIVIMDEAFSDLSVLGEVSVNKEVTPFISSLKGKENVISGYALASVYGGNTVNSEYEFLTGNTMAWLSQNVVPYQQYMRAPTYSMVSHLKSTYGYRCVAMHPYLASGWNRPSAYEYLGFDECYFIEDFPRKDYVRMFISDREMFSFLIDTYETQKEEPLFLFGVTMQNHGDYSYGEDVYTKHVSLREHGEAFPDVEQYLSLVNETDKAVEQLLTYFQSVEEDVVIVFFGDHQPKIDESFYETVSGKKTESLDEIQRRYKVPFFVWANYDIEESYIECSSLNYLSSYVYDAAGIDLPPYNRFLQDMEPVIPTINANGFYSPAQGRYLPFDEANEEESQWLEWYEILQYNSLFDKENKNQTLFPALEQ